MFISAHFCNYDTTAPAKAFGVGKLGMNFESDLYMEQKKHKRPDLNDQVHSEFETSIGSHYDVVRDETVKKQRANDDDGPLNQLENEEPVKNEQPQGEETPKMNADPDSL
jgi:hypothetical protein